MIFGADTWDLNKKVRRSLNNSNNVMLTYISGKSIQKENWHWSMSFNLVKMLKQTIIIGFHFTIWSKPTPIPGEMETNDNLLMNVSALR